METLSRFKTPREHHRDMLAIARQQVALACARSLCDPNDQRWPEVITRLTDWMRRLQRDGEIKLLTH